MHRTLLCSLPVSSARDHRRMPFRAAAGALSPRKCKYSSPILPLCSALSVFLSQDVHAMLVHAMLAHAMLTHTFTSPRRGTSPRHLAALLPHPPRAHPRAYHLPPHGPGERSSRVVNCFVNCIRESRYSLSKWQIVARAGGAVAVRE